MKIQAVNTRIQNTSADAILIDHFEDTPDLFGEVALIDQRLNGAIRERIDSNDFCGRLNEVTVLYTHGALPSPRVILLGMGRKKHFSSESIHQAAAVGAKKARELGCRSIAAIVPGISTPSLDRAVTAQALVEGVLLGLYRWQTNQSAPVERADPDLFYVAEADLTQLSAIERGIQAGTSIARGVCLARDLVNQAPNLMTPLGLAAAAEKMARETGLRCTVHEVKWITEQKMTALTSVAQGSANLPAFIELEYQGSREAPIVFVGKGVTFDSGGISLKPPEGMAEMSSDMGGAAVLIGAIQAIADLKLPLHVVGLIPACENLPGGKAYRPGDVIRSRSGKTIEIITTDAEGRVTLADALDYAADFKPQAVIDLATLTGSSVTALGENVAAAYFSNDDPLSKQVEEASRATGEKLWRLPLYPEYRDKIKSDYADLKNAGGKYGGVGASASFLEEFTSYPWAHWDIASMVLDIIGPTAHYPLTHPPHIPYGATGFGVQALVSLARNWKSKEQ
ncbi:MAG: leucyl aminopeptidase [Chloroflexi bacterium]|nr:leucyl aminopeptidase [Chloroflexota bacterium]